MKKNIYVKGTMILLFFLVISYFLNKKVFLFQSDNYYIYSNISVKDLIIRNTLFLIFSFFLIYISKGLLSIMLIFGNLYWFTYAFIEMHHRLNIPESELLFYLSIHGIFELIPMIIIFVISCTSVKFWYKEIFKEQSTKTNHIPYSIYFLICWVSIIIGGVMESHVSQNLILHHVRENGTTIITP